MTCRWLMGILPLMLSSVAVSEETSAKPKRQPTYAGRTFEEWKELTLSDYDKATRSQGYAALATFGRHGREAEAIATIQNGLDLEQDANCLEKAYGAVCDLGKVGEPPLIRGLQRGGNLHAKAILEQFTKAQVLGQRSPGDAVIDAFLLVVKSKDFNAPNRALACRAAAGGTMRRTFSVGKSPQYIVEVHPVLPPILNQVVPVLEQALTDPEPEVRNSAAVGLLWISRRKPPLVATVLDYLDAELAKIPAASQEPEMARVMRQRGGNVYMGNYSNDVLQELANFRYYDYGVKSPPLLPSLSHLKTLEEKYPGANNSIRTVIQIAEAELGLPAKRKEGAFAPKFAPRVPPR